MRAKISSVEFYRLSFEITVACNILTLDHVKMWHHSRIWDLRLGSASQINEEDFVGREVELK